MASPTDEQATASTSCGFRYAAIAYAVGLAVHTFDHFRRGIDAISPQVFWLGIAGTTLAIAAILAILAGHRRAPELAVLAGFSQAIGVVLVHFGPPMGRFSDPLLGGGPGIGSAAAASVEVLGALAAGLFGAWIIARSRTDPATAVHR